MAVSEPVCDCVERVVVGPIETNCYILDAHPGTRGAASDGGGPAGSEGAAGPGGETGCIVVDPGWDAPAIFKALRGRKVGAVLVTHAHFDHVGALDALAAASETGFAVSALDAPRLAGCAEQGRRWFGEEAAVTASPARLLEDGDVVCAGGFRLRVVACPGHTPGGVAYVDDARGFALTGDTLFRGSAGRTDLDGGDVRALYASLAKLGALPAQTLVLPGHGPASTVGAELSGNPHMVRAARVARRG